MIPSSVLLVLTTFITTQAREIQVNLQAPWTHRTVHPLIEVSEFLAEQSSSDFWTYVDTLCSTAASMDAVDAAMSSSSEESLLNMFQLAQTVGVQIVPSNVQNILEVSNNIGMYLPAVQFYESLAASADSPCGPGNSYVIQYPGGVVSCSPESDNASPIPTLTDETVNMPWNHEFPFGPEKKDAPYDHSEVQVLYGVIGSTSFCKLHTQLSSMAAGGSKRYIVRHAFPEVAQLSGHRDVQGYGVFLDIKNMEYHNAAEVKEQDSDEAAAQLQQQELEEENFLFDKDEEVEGVIFSTLHDRYPHLTKELKIAREELLSKAEAGGDSSAMKMWKVLDLGLQTTQSITAASAASSTSDSVTVMNNILHNFPKHASSLSSVRVDEELKETAIHYYRSGAMQGIPINSLFINGLRIDLSAATLNIFDIISNIRQELKNSDYLTQKGISVEVKKEMLRHAASLSSGGASTATTREEQMMEFVRSIKRVDVSLGGRYSIQFLNNLEKDPQYKRLPKSVTALLQPSWQLTGLARNIYTLVAIVNPVSIEGASMLFQLNQVHEQQYPVRIGVVWACNAPLSASARQNHGASAEDVCRLYGEAKSAYGLKAAMAVVSRIAGMIEEEAEDKFEPSLVAAEGSIATAAAQNDIFVTKEQAAELYADAIAAHNQQWTSKNDYYEEASRILSNGEKGADFVKNTTLYLTQRGLPTNSFSLNGMVMESDDVMTHLMQLLGREQQLLSILVSMKKVTDKSKSIFSSILKVSPSFTRYHSLIEEVAPEYIDTSTADYKLLDQNIGNVFDSHLVSQQACGASPEEMTPSLLYNTTIVAVPVHTEFGLRSLQAALKWFLETVLGSTVSEEGRLCTAIDDVNHYGHRLGVVFRAPHGSASVQHLQRMAILSVMLQSKDPNAIFILKTTVEFLLADIPLNDILKQLREIFESGGLVGDGKVLDEVVSMLALIGQDPGKVLDVLEGRLAVSSHALKASAHATRAFDSVDVEDVALHFNSRKLVVPSAKGTPLHALDLTMLVDIEYPRLGAPLTKTLQAHPGKIVSGGGDNDNDGGDYVPFSGADFLFMSSYCGRYAASGGNRVDVMGVLEEAGFAVEGSHEGHVPSDKFIMSVEGDSSTSRDVSLVFVVHPLTMAGQRTAALVKLIQEQLQMSQTVILVPQMDLSDFPLQNFYRFISPSSATSNSVTSLSGIFKSLPRQHTLTVRIDTPEAWNVQTLAAEQDIDNFKCSKYKCGDELRAGETANKEVSRVSYQLKNIAIAGQCYEGWSTGRPNPPNGLQLVLNQARSPLSLAHKQEGDGSNANCNSSSSATGNDADTLVMKNLGYYQLQANPGLWQLGLAEGRAASLYTLDDAKGRGQESIWVPVLSFTSAMHQLFATKRPGMETLSLLDAEGGDATSPDQGMWGKLSSQMQGLWGGSGGKAVVPAGEDEDNRIHIFSLATGQVYERLLRIMMLSAVKRTSVPIKFWLFEYYLSPAFKATVEAMAAKYNFEVGYVVYKWPEWLNQQTEKQRIIWGYKILFLDVLFPLNVKKVIYVDADQVVRADLKELWDMDLEGKAYAYTPFCDSREETLGFQFWRQGYWADHLRGRPYHISALYVVDLQVFRQRAVGDSLRAVYDQLSKDPNSLSNLDQDLPNYAQHIVPIHSLPQEWLWCESWCSDKTKKQAKTIDLCNNPLHKEPKLDMAKRVINGSLFPESWVELDEEIKATILKTGMTVEY